MKTWWLFIFYWREQTKHLLFLVGIYILPLLLFLKFSPYQAPYVQYVVLAVLVTSEYVFFNEKNFRKRFEKRAQARLTSERGRPASKNDVSRRLELMRQMQMVSLFFVILVLGLIILLFA